jgi:DHA1 family bicyclomycin/chloramphenicol resistance-like MFS transporter
MLQATVAAGIALGRAIVRDMVPMSQAASLLGYVTMGMALVPMIAPTVGGLLDEALGWQAVFAFVFVFGAAVTALVWADLGETNRTPSTSFAAQFRAYPELLRSQTFWGYSLSAALASGSFFVFLGGGPWVATEVLGMGPAQVGLHFGFISVGYMLGNFLSGRLATRLGLHRMMLSGAVAGVMGVVLALVVFWLGFATPATFFGTMLFIGLGNGLLLPSANAGIVSVQPHLAGSASGLGGAMMIGAGAALSSLAGALLGPGTGAWPLLWVMLATALLCLAATVHLLVVAGRRGP